MGHDGSAAEADMAEVITHLLAAAESARRAPDQAMLVRLIEAVLLHAGHELARRTPPSALGVADEA